MWTMGGPLMDHGQTHAVEWGGVIAHVRLVYIGCGHVACNPLLFFFGHETDVPPSVRYACRSAGHAAVDRLGMWVRGMGPWSSRVR